MKLFYYLGLDKKLFLLVFMCISRFSTTGAAVLKSNKEQVEKGGEANEANLAPVLRSLFFGIPIGTFFYSKSFLTPLLELLI